VAKHVKRLWRRLKALYVWACRHLRKDRLTISAWAHKEALEGRPWWRDRIDGAFLFWASEHQHCQSRWQRETDELTK
jgi:hypothetical protein